MNVGSNPTESTKVSLQVDNLFYLSTCSFTYYLRKMTESQIQKKRIKELESQGYYVIRLVKTNKNGIPDLIAIPPNAPVLFSEIKRPTTGPSKLQEFRIKELKSKGFKVEIYDGQIRD